MKIAIVVGTRPEIIKMSPIIRLCQRKKIPFFVLHTGQHYSPNMDEIFFKELELPKPRYNLHVGSDPYNLQVGKMVNLMIPILKKEKADVVLVQGDTLSVLAGALAGHRAGALVAHHEAGLRSYDISMLEEINRVIVDHLSHLLFAPTPDALKNLHSESRSVGKIYFTGNTVVESVLQNINLAKQKSKILEKLDLKEQQYILVTAHRAENVDSKKKLQGILHGLNLVSNTLKKQIVFVIHPRTKNRIKQFKLKKPKKVKFVDPVGFLDMLMLESNAALLITDSGGLQEESCILKIPCVTIRENTERPETIEIGQNMFVGTDPKKIFQASKKMIKKKLTYEKSPFGDGKASVRILQHLLTDAPKMRKKSFFRRLF